MLPDKFEIQEEKEAFLARLEATDWNAPESVAAIFTELEESQGADVAQEGKDQEAGADSLLPP